MAKIFQHKSCTADTARIDWDLGNACNLDCCYCPPNTKQGNFSNPGIETQKSFASDMLDYYDSIGKRPIISFGISGEPTVLPDFAALLKFLHNRVAGISVSTNLTAPIEWWQENGYLIHNVNGTIHYQNGYTVKSLFETITEIEKYAKNFKLSVPMLPDKFDEQITDIEWFKKYSSVPIIPHPILQNLYSGGRWISYTDEQKSQLESYYQFESHKVSTHETISSVASAIEPKKSFDVFYTESDSERCFTGWTCFAGQDTLVIDSRGFVRRGWCPQFAMEQRHMTEWIWNMEPVSCNMSYCRLHTDLLARKQIDN